MRAKNWKFEIRTRSLQIDIELHRFFAFTIKEDINKILFAQIFLQLSLVFLYKRFDNSAKRYYHNEHDVDMFQYFYDALSCPI